MRLLQSGITGFGATAEVPTSRIKGAVYTAALTIGAKVGDIRPADGVTPSFHQIDIQFGSRAFVVLCNRHVPIVAFAERAEGLKIERFLEAPADFAAALSDCGFVIGPIAELNRVLTDDDLQCLSSSEQKQANYWKPERVGDIIFNWWD